MIPLLLFTVACLLGPTAPGARISSGAPGRPIRPVHRMMYPLVGLLAVLSASLVTPPTVVLSVTALAGTCVWWGRSVRRDRRNARTADATAEILGGIVSDLRAGTTMPDAVRAALDNRPGNGGIPARITETLQTAARRATDGPGAALILAEARDLPDLAAAGRLWNLSEQHGLPLAMLLEQAQRRTDARIRHRERTRAALQGPQVSAVILTLLPGVGMMMGTLIGADPLPLLTGGGTGGVLLLGGVLFTCVGIIVSRIIILRAAGDTA
ncbi:type II secretion system F family protein [Corynebacterium pygosceleis]|uniref:type II secretion system F family protein n=1 Tax=Corynebacterium pygosceleis TaxID=2800406 RepID=UPI001906E1C2|nr:type II secretion system F family protein [Corynebacterium pygosceleis]